MDYKKSYIIFIAGPWVGILIGLFGNYIEVNLLSYIGSVILLASLLQTIIFYRCPSCKKLLSVIYKDSDCPKCGLKL